MNDVARQRGEQRYCKIDEYVLYHPSLSDKAVRIWGVINRFARDSPSGWPGVETIAKKVHGSTSTVRRCLKELVDAGVLEINPRFRSDGSQTSNEYVLIWTPPVISEPHPLPKMTGAPSVDDTLKRDRERETGKDTLCPPPANGLFPEPPSAEDPDAASTDASKQSGTSTPIALPPASVDFARWWNWWPGRKVKRATAEKAFRKLAPLDQHAATSGVILFKDAMQGVPKSKQGLMGHPATWLNGRRWEDDPDDWRADAEDWIRQAQRDGTSVARSEPSDTPTGPTVSIDPAEARRRAMAGVEDAKRRRGTAG